VASSPGDRGARHVPYVDLARQHGALKADVLRAVERVLDHGHFILGPEVEQFECAIEERLGVRHAVSVANGTDAIVLALRGLGIGPGDEVLTPSHSFVATALAVRLVGATPVFVEVEEETMLLDPAGLERALSARSRGVLAVHLNGFPCAMEGIAEFCHQHGLALIEDCAQALGARYRGRSVGSFGIGCFSLHPLKPLGACGDGGILTTADDELAARLRMLRNLGLRDRDHCDLVGGNCRLDALQAAILLIKLAHLDDWLVARRARATRYREALDGQIRLPPAEGDDLVTYTAFVVRHPQRDRLLERLAARGVDVKVHYPLAIHQQAAFADLPPPHLPVTERVVHEILSLPVSPELALEDQEWVIQALREALVELDS
jgi:dTDP-4-amino-4,6-dideoxygalactose transaminase